MSTVYNKWRSLSSHSTERFNDCLSIGISGKWYLFPHLSVMQEFLLFLARCNDCSVHDIIDAIYWNLSLFEFVELLEMWRIDRGLPYGFFGSVVE